MHACGVENPVHAGDIIAQSKAKGTAQIKSPDPDPLDTERFASASDYSKGENITPAKAQLQTIVGREKQRVAGEFEPGTMKHTSSRKQIGAYIMTSERGSFGTQNLRVTNQTESDGHVTGITEVGILEFKRVEGPAELQIAKYCMRQMRDMRSSSSRLYLHSFMPMATCEVVGSELRFGDVGTCTCSILAESGGSARFGSALCPW
ncbi:hypothetical protein WJX77_011404 [Trebouxia sp. C0004]